MLDIRLKSIPKIKKKLNEFDMIKKVILNQLAINKKNKLYKVVDKIN